jgi:two-component system, NarL family, response regulator NreC
MAGPEGRREGARVTGSQEGGSPRDPGPLRVALVEDHALMREGMRALLGETDDLEIVGEASTLREAASIRVRPDVIVSDLVLPDGRGPSVVAEIASRFPDAAILVVSMIDNPADVQMSFAAGARGYLPKEAASTELIDAIRQVAAGHEYLHPRLGAMLASRARAGGPGPSASLTDREIAVLRLIGAGHTNAEIAAILRLSLRTIEKYRSTLHRRLGVHTRAELVREAVARGLLEQG